MSANDAAVDSQPAEVKPEECPLALSGTALAVAVRMILKKQLKRHLGKKTTRRIYAAMPWVGGALAFAASTYLERRGVRGAVNDLREATSSVNAKVKRAAADVERRGQDLVDAH